LGHSVFRQLVGFPLWDGRNITGDLRIVNLIVMSEMLLGAPGVACEGAPTPQGAPRAAGAMASG